MYGNGDMILAEKVGCGIFNEKVRSATNRCFNPNGYIDEDEYVVLQPLESEEVTVDTTQASPAVIEMFTALSRKIVSLERQLADTQRNLEKFAEQTESNSEDIRTLDSRTQVINAITKFYEEGRR
jgi:DNA repair ATPase RecN